MRYEAIVIGAGQAGLAMGYYLKQNNNRFLIIDKGQECRRGMEKSIRLLKVIYT